MVWPAYYIQTGHFSWFPVWASLPVCFLISGIHHANDMRDMQYDGEAGITTLALVLGKKTSMQLFHLLYLGVFLSTIGLLITGSLPWTAALPLLLCPAALKMLAQTRRVFWVDQEHIGVLEPLSAGFHFKFGILLILGVCLHPLVSRIIPAG
jgi:1,4-dihydroxy-2-naphthoate octaprenyltransferase